MNLGQLEYLVEVVRSSSYVSAAKKLYVTPQAISKSMNELEKELNIDLFVKSGRGVKPTDFASILASKAEDPLSSFADFRQFVANLLKQGIDYGTISLGVATAHYRGGVLAPEHFNAFRREYPYIKLDLICCTSESCLAAVQEGVLDASIILGELNSPDFDCQKILSFSPLIAVFYDHPLASSESIFLKQLDGCRLAVPFDLRHVYAKLKKKLKERDVKVAFENVAPFARAHREFIASGGAVFVSRNSYLAREHSEIKVIPFKKEERPIFSLYFISKKVEDPSPIPLLAGYLNKTARRMAMGL